jgi:hypothetical protein
MLHPTTNGLAPDGVSMVRERGNGVERDGYRASQDLTHQCPAPTLVHGGENGNGVESGTCCGTINQLSLPWTALAW